eukprot:m.76709 g.76709  ORF g.76709 m.76709 type:complete len:237 (-) comp9084_c0_seq2:227-937(-)
MSRSHHAVVIASALLALGTTARAGDPSEGWLSYAVYNAPKPTDIITRLSASMTVPPELEGDGMPAFWFGVQTAKGDGALIQPIMSKYLGDGWYMFQEIFDWTDGNDEQSTQMKVKPGETIWAEVVWKAATRSYAMNMTSSSGQMSTYEYKLLPAQTETESAGYFVLEHQVEKCNGLPSSGKVQWTGVSVEVNGEKVPDAQWVAKEENPVCGAKAVVVNTTTIDIVWTPSTAPVKQL